MAASLLNHEANGRIRVTSAGSQPATELNPAVVQAMAELGLDISRELPKRLTTERVTAADVVITMGCGDACPIYPGKRYLDWDLPDPALPRPTLTVWPAQRSGSAQGRNLRQT
jgi:arsenate reductase (thioredoxin)